MKATGGPLRLALAALIPLAVALVCAGDPFHGDAVPNTSRPALQLLAVGPGWPLFVDRYDAGHPTLFPLLLAGVWRVFGASLPVAHGFSLLMAWLTLAGVWRLARRFLSSAGASWAALFASGGAVFLAQTALVQSALPLAGAFVWALWALVAEKRLTFAAAALVLVLLHLEGCMLLATLGVVDIVWRWHYGGLPDRRWLLGRLAMYAPAAGAFGLWLAAHQAATGWAVVSPEYAAHRGGGGLGGTLYNVGILAWRWMDHGYGLLWAFILLFLKVLPPRGEDLGGSQTRREAPSPTQPKGEGEWNRFLILLLVAAVVLSVLLAALNRGPLGHRYVLPVQLAAAVGAAVAVERMATQGRRRATRAVLALGLLGGNFLTYPGKCMGDATLHYRSVFALESEIAEKWGGTPVHAYAPHSSPREYRYLSDIRGLETRRLYEAPPDSLRLVLRSNLSCEFSAVKRDSLLRVWPCECYERGGVQVELFVHPSLAEKRVMSGPCPESESARWLRGLKRRIRGEACADC